MPINSFDENPFAVHEQVAVTNFNFSKTDICRDNFQDLARWVFEREQEFIKIGCLG